MLKKKIEDFLDEGEDFLAGVPFQDAAKLDSFFRNIAVDTVMLTQVGVASSSELETDGSKDWQHQSYLIATNHRILYARKTKKGAVSRIAGEMNYSAISSCQFNVESTMFSKPLTGSVRIQTVQGDTFLDSLRCDIPKLHLKDAEYFADEVREKLNI
tara:strand:- start:555 stop:1025 length:471 start_codon:yes stop_codon:yes gene_type:complete